MQGSKTPGPEYIRERRHHAKIEPVKRSQTPESYERRGQNMRNVHRHTQDAAHAHYTRARTQTLPSGVKPEAQFNEEWMGNGSYTYSQKRHEHEAKAEEIDFEARVRMVREETRRIAAMREVERTRLIQEEVRRVRAKIQQRRDHEWQYILRKLYEEEEERERQRQEVVKWAVSNAWALYEKRWTSLANSAQPLTFAAIPWPTLSKPSSPASLTIRTISSFLLSTHHSANMSPKDRIKQALKRWHPDRFGRILAKAKAEDKVKIEEGAGIVARCLNELLHSEAGRSVN